METQNLITDRFIWIFIHQKNQGHWCFIRLKRVCSCFKRCVCGLYYMFYKMPPNGFTQYPFSTSFNFSNELNTTVVINQSRSQGPERNKDEKRNVIIF